MNTTMTHVTVAAQPGWFLTVFTKGGDIDRYEPIIAWEIQRTASSNGIVIRFPIPITAESKNKDLDCAIWGIKRPDGVFVFTTGENEWLSKEELSKFARLMETEGIVEKLALSDKSKGNADNRLEAPEAALVPH